LDFERMAWRHVAEKLGLSRGMLMMVLRGDRRLSAKALFKLEEAEREAADRRSAAERIVEGLIGDRSVVRQMLGQNQKGKGTVEVAVEYETARPSRSLPVKISLVSPAEEDCRKLQTLFAETLDTRVIALACLPRQLRNEGFIDQLTAESRTRLTNAALGLVIPDWRTLVAATM
jgi:transcriptional regulator with XRE-family HTH domain